MSTYAEFADKHGITMDVKPASEFQEKRSSGAVKWTVYKYTCTLHYRGRSETFPYHVGEGIIVNWLKNETEFLDSIVAKNALFPLGRVKTVFEAELVERYAPYYKPAIKDLLYCLAQDGITALEALDFEEWAEECGYDTDSREAERVYDKIVEQTKKIRRLLGTDLCKELFVDTTEEDEDA